MKFVKLNNNNQFVAVSPSICPNFATGMYMQDFTSAMCANAPTPSGTDYFPIGVLTDRRDNKKYEVRKFADGNCWMVDNLAYGGSDLNNGIDGCMKTSFCNYGYNTDGSCILAFNNFVPIVDKIAPGLYGDCVYTYASTQMSDDKQYGYLYNWQATIQDANAYYGSDYQPTQPVRGLCPDGWYLPTGGPNGQFQSLNTAAGSPTTGFWQTDGSWQGGYAGGAFMKADGGTRLEFQELAGLYSTSTPVDAERVYYLNLRNDLVGLLSIATKASGGWSVRCLKTP